MYKKAVCILFLFNGYVICASSVASSWIHLAEALNESIKSCPENVSFSFKRLKQILIIGMVFQLEIFDCLRQSSLNVFDKIITSDVIPITLYARLLRNDHKQKTSFNSDANHHGGYNKSMERSDTSLSKESWSEHVLLNIVNLLRTHSLDIDYTQGFISGRGNKSE